MSDLFDDDSPPDTSSAIGLRRLIETQRDTLIAVATGSPISGYATSYSSRRHLIRSALKSRGLADPFQWSDLNLFWAWAKGWPTYAERRTEVGRLINPLIDTLSDIGLSGTIDDWGGSPSHWAQLEGRLAGLREEMDNATSLDHFQDVGRRGREIIIATVNELFKPDMVVGSEEQPKAADAKTRFDYVLDAHSPGSSHEELRSLLRAAWKLSQKVTHGNVTRVDAFATAQATVLLVRTLAEMHASLTEDT